MRTMRFCGELRRETDGAYLVFEGVSEVWIPKSVAQDVELTGDLIECTIPEWLAIEKGVV